MILTPYSLLNYEDNSNRFYDDLEQFSDLIIIKAELSLGNYVNDYIQSLKLQQNNRIAPRERVLELILLGVFWINYSGKAHSTPRFKTWLPQQLYSLRRRSSLLKPGIDRIRGPLAYSLLENNRNSFKTPVSLSSLDSLLNWLKATGEFREEVERLMQWRSFLSSKSEHYQLQLISSCIHYAFYFTARAKNALGQYTYGLNEFHDQHLEDYRQKEDYFLASRKENEYHLNMIAAALLNRSMRHAFTQTSRKALLLPTCMRTEPQSGCKSVSDGKADVCCACNPDCNIGRAAKAMKSQGITTYIIPHSSDFTRFLKLWRGQKDTGLIGVACILNLLTGGYEMQRLNLPSQCVFLNHCGCKKHWGPCNKSTNLNINQLNKVIDNKKQDLMEAC